MEEHVDRSQKHNDGPNITSKIEILRNLEESQEPEAEEPQFQIVIVSVNGELYGIRILSVREILKVENITWVPCVPEYIMGVISVRGDVQCVVDLQHFLQLGFSQISENSRIILVESEEFITGLLVDEMVDIVEIPVSRFLPLTESNMNVAQKYIEGRLSWNESTMALLDVDMLIQGVVVDQG